MTDQRRDLLDKLKAIETTASPVRLGTRPSRRDGDRARARPVRGRHQRQADADVRLQQLPRPDARAGGRGRRARRAPASTAPARPARARPTARLSLHEDLEREFADWFGKRHALIFSTGYQANLSVIGGLCGADDIILIDSDSHASIYDATRHTAVAGRRLPPQLAGKPAQEARAPAGRPAQPAGRRRRALFDPRRRGAAPRDRRGVPRLRRVSAGRRSALARHVRSRPASAAPRRRASSTEVDFIVGTFSKSLAGVGGVCVSDHAELRALHFLARAYVFTASGSPANVASVRAAVRVIREHPELRDRLWANVRQISRRSAEARLPHRPDRVADRADLHRRGRTHDCAVAGTARRGALREPDRAARLPAGRVRAAGELLGRAHRRAHHARARHLRARGRRRRASPSDGRTRLRRLPRIRQIQPSRRYQAAVCATPSRRSSAATTPRCVAQPIDATDKSLSRQLDHTASD